MAYPVCSPAKVNSRGLTFFFFQLSPSTQTRRRWSCTRILVVLTYLVGKVYYYYCTTNYYEGLPGRYS